MSSEQLVRIVPIVGYVDALGVRSVRNAVLPFLTGDARPVSVPRQLAWFHREVRTGRVHLFGMYAWWRNTADRWVGYGLVRPAPEGRLVVSGGLLPTARGRGLGWRLFCHLTEVARTLSQIVHLEVWDWNAAAVGLYEMIGYRECAPRRHARNCEGRPGQVITMSLGPECAISPRRLGPT